MIYKNNLIEDEMIYLLFNEFVYYYNLRNVNQ